MGEPQRYFGMHISTILASAEDRDQRNFNIARYDLLV